MTSAESTAPVLPLGPLVLRPFRDADAAPFHALLCGPEVLRYFPRTEPPPLDRVRRLLASYEEHWRRRGFGIWAVEDAATGVLMGRCGLQELPDTGEIEVDFLLGRDHWGRGHTTLAARAGLRFGFETRGIESIVGIVHPDNGASRRVLEKIGLAAPRRTVYFGMDCYRYEITRDAWRAASIARVPEA